jgi:hypothetical protein
VLGIDEACSGVRSLQATLMVSLFLGEIHRLKIGARVALVAIGFGAAFLTNIGRSHARRLRRGLRLWESFTIPPATPFLRFAS